MTDLEKYKEDILRLKEYFSKQYSIDLPDKEALNIIKEYEKKEKERLKHGKH